MSITDELRKWASVEVPYKYGHQLLAIADRIDAEHESEVSCTADKWDYWESTHVELPRDADGEYIHVGDVMETENFGVVEVEGFIHKAIAFSVYDPQPARICTVPASQCRHHHEPTVEDVLCEMIDAIDDDRYGQDRIIAEYAAKLRLAEGEES